MSIKRYQALHVALKVLNYCHYGLTRDRRLTGEVDCGLQASFFSSKHFHLITLPSLTTAQHHQARRVFKWSSNMR